MLMYRQSPFGGYVGLIVLAIIISGALVPQANAANGGWGLAVIIETENAGGANNPQVAVDSSGNAVAVWDQFDGTRSNIYANRYVVGSGWGTTTLIETDNLAGASSPQVAVDPNGNAIAVWHQSDATRFNIWANRYVVGTGWGTATKIETDDTASALYPQVAMDPSGNAVAVWYQSDGTRNNIWANRYVVGTGWGGTGTLIETDNAGSAINPQVAMDSNGNAIAVWYQYDGTRYNVVANRFVVGSGWGGTGTLIETDNAGDAAEPQVAMDSSGNAIAVWYQWDGTRDNIWANRYVVGTGWGATGTLIETDSNEAYYSQVDVDISGNAIAVWYQYDGTRYNVVANRYVVGTGWGTAGVIETQDTGGSVLPPSIGLDSSGNALAVWDQWDGGRYNIWANRYVVGAGWGTATLVETDNTSHAYGASVSVNSDGDAMAVWQQFDGARYNIWANRYLVPDNTPPSITLSGPTGSISTQSPFITVSGTTDPGSTLTVNGLLVAVAANGTFSVRLPLTQGVNTINIMSIDAAGNISTSTVTVTYEVPFLQANLPWFILIAVVVGFVVAMLLTRPKGPKMGR